MMVCRTCGTETIGINIFFRYCPNGLDDDHRTVIGDVVIPHFIKCEKCGGIYPTSHATHYHFVEGWTTNTYSLVFNRPDLYDVNRHLCYECTPDCLKKWDWVRKQITGKGK